MGWARWVLVGPAALSLTGCGADDSGEDFAEEVYEAYASGDVGRLEKYMDPPLEKAQRTTMADVMHRCPGVDGSVEVIEGEVSVLAKYLAFAVDCDGTRSVLVGRIYADSDETDGADGWSLSPIELPGGEGVGDLDDRDLGPLDDLPRLH